MENYIEVHFGEIWLRGRNRPDFINALISNISKALEGERYGGIIDARDRLLIKPKGVPKQSIYEKLGKVFGISWYAKSILVGNSIEEIIEGACKLAKEQKINKLKIVAHRSAKITPFNSYQIVSEFIKNNQKLSFTPAREANDTLYINITGKGAFMHINRFEGAGGIPVGTEGRAIVLLSGGIDSPVAAYMAMKRGIKPVYLHVHPFQNCEEAKSSKIAKLVGIMAQYGNGAKVYYAPAHIFQSSVLSLGKKYGRYETIVFKRFLFKLAEKIAVVEGAEAIVTGESLGQVSSQTASNMNAASYGIKALILRPLVTYDKNDIVENARKIGTFNISTIPYKDVCSITARNPKTRAEPELIEELCSKARIDQAVERTMEKMCFDTFG
ncbi:MAG: tRNA sulfurtransferase [Candidatus Micrarchaeia archaeon]